jgi:hypothetical protein
MVNPRVDGSIPALATTSNSMISMRFPASPTDYPCPMASTIGLLDAESEVRFRS